MYYIISHHNPLPHHIFITQIRNMFPILFITLSSTYINIHIPYYMYHPMFPILSLKNLLIIQFITI